MKRTILIGMLIFGYTSFINAQCQLVIGNDRAYEATCFESLQGEGMAALGLDIAFVDKGSGRVVLKGSLGAIFGNGTAYLYLEDNTVVKLIDRDIRWKVNHRTHIMYYLTRSEVGRLQRKNIISIRVPGIDGYLQYVNKGVSYLNKDPTDFPRLISNLFN